MPINEAERKLTEYRARKKKEATYNKYKAEIRTLFSKFLKNDQENGTKKAQKEDLSTTALNEQSSSDAESFDSDSMQLDKSSLTIFDYIQYCLWLILWITVYAMFIKLQFGTIYLIISGLVGIYLNTRTGPKRKNEVSAYSVFNKNCESIEGTLDADKLTKEMFYGGFSR